jgi:hypothetical protein
MLIFHKFNDRAHAEQCASGIVDRFAVTTYVCTTQAESNMIDPFPFMLEGCVLLAERNEEDEKVVEFVKEQGGTFAGT